MIDMKTAMVFITIFVIFIMFLLDKDMKERKEIYKKVIIKCKRIAINEIQYQWCVEHNKYNETFIKGE